MDTKRQLISLLRIKLKEVNADSIYPNKFLFHTLEEHAKWLLRREWVSGKLKRNVTIFQKLPCLKTIEVNKVDCPDFIKGKTIYRTICKLPDMWQHDSGPMIIRVSSIDNFTPFTLVSSTSSENKSQSPYRQYFRDKYTYYEGGYLYFTEDPGRVTVRAFFREDISSLNCDGVCTAGCRRYLDTAFYIPEWIEAELVEKCFQTLIGTKQIQNDENINSNANLIN